MKIFIPYNVPSSKNSKQWTGKRLVSSKSVQAYRKNTAPYWIKYKQKFLTMLKTHKKPYRVHFKFVRGTRHHFDYINPLQTVQDEMVKYGWIDDDDMNNLLPVIEEYEYNKDNSGVYIWLEF